ncbi:mrna binding protein pumilio 2 [Diplodia corticola]|uniref:Pumilio homology domain family member 3 n=1 Tax=Diplodia corticola TaxID=236234 RepID=A0A1J9S7M9_9PEZI|nr:mrna binding protein pumilio 2 [Diplodia corticola]OJD36495.1 mrna binding protein pumilio 2 [Diplodia corticola]
MPSRLTDFGAVRSPEDERTPAAALPQNNYTNGSNGWRGGNIWGNGALGTFASRERTEFPTYSPASRTNVGSENGSFRASLPEEIEGKTGSGSLVASSESDHWGPRRTTPWNTADTSAQPISAQRRASSVSPVSQVQASQAYADPSQPRAYPVSRASIAGQGLGSKAVNMPANFVGRRATEDGYGVDLARLVELDQRQRSTDSMRWTDAPHLHSPADDRRSIANSDYISSSSAAQSRSGSLPPSRHGSDPVQYPQPTDAFARFPGARGHNASLSQTNGRYNERTDSMASDVMSSFARMSMDSKAPDQPMAFHKPSFSTPGGVGQFGHSSHASTYSRATLGDITQNVLGSDEVGAGTFTPDGFPSQYDQSFSYRNHQLATRGSMTPNGDFRTNYYSTGGTPPVYDHLYPSRNAQNGRPAHDGHSAMLDRKLRNVQQEQQAFIHPGYQQMLAAQYGRPFDPYGFHMSMGMAPGIPMHIPTMPGMIQQLEPPKGPRQEESGTGLRSAMLEEFRHNMRTKRYDLKDIYEYICEFSGDQHGSRFIQLRLESANSDEKERVFKEIQPNAIQLMTDVFGNYVIQKFFEHGDQNQKRILAGKMKGHVLNLSVQMYGCRVVQKALEHVLVDQQAEMVKELENSVVKCVKDQNGNHVIQKAIERVPAQHIQFIIDSFIGQVSALSVHGYGCRVIQRMLEHCEEPARRTILRELHACAAILIPDQYGNYVTQHIIEHGAPEDRAAIIEIVKDNLFHFAKHKFASNVVEKCLVFGSDDERREIMMKICEKPAHGESTIMMLIKDGFGNYVLQKLLDTLNATDYLAFLEHLQPEMNKAKKTLAGKQVQAVGISADDQRKLANQIEKVEKKMRRLDKYELVPDSVQRNSMSPTSVPETPKSSTTDEKSTQPSSPNTAGTNSPGAERATKA